jgi:hypothetical protein
MLKLKLSCEKVLTGFNTFNILTVLTVLVLVAVLIVKGTHADTVEVKQKTKQEI